MKGRSTTDFADFTDGSGRGGPPFGFSSHRPSWPLAEPNLRLSWPRRTVQDKEAGSLCQCQGGLFRPGLAQMADPAGDSPPLRRKLVALTDAIGQAVANAKIAA